MKKISISAWLATLSVVFIAVTILILFTDFILINFTDGKDINGQAILYTPEIYVLYVAVILLTLLLITSWRARQFYKKFKW